MTHPGQRGCARPHAGGCAAYPALDSLQLHLPLKDLGFAKNHRHASL